MFKDQCATSEMLQGNRLLVCKYWNGYEWRLGWEADQNHQLTWNFDSLPRTSLSKNKNRIPFYPFSQGRKKDGTEELYKFGRPGFTELLL